MRVAHLLFNHSSCLERNNGIYLSTLPATSVGSSLMVYLGLLPRSWAVSSIPTLSSTG